jgi:hypothetical protein
VERRSTKRSLHAGFRRAPRRALGCTLAAILMPATIGTVVWLTAPPRSEPPAAVAGPDLDRLEDTLRRDVRELSVRIGERHAGRPEELREAIELISGSLSAAGYRVRRRAFEVAPRLHARYTRSYLGPDEPLRCVNLEAELTAAGPEPEIVVVGAHYDSAIGSPGADDNASGVAALLALARRLRDRRLARTVRFVAFANEEPPFFATEAMGSRVYARRARARGEPIRAMIALDSLGYYDHRPRSQRHPPLLSLVFPSTGDFVAVVGDLGSARLARRVAARLRDSRMATETVVAPGWLRGIGWSDHASFWRHGYPAVLVTDTAGFRNPAYHRPDDRAETLSYRELARLVAALESVVLDLAGGTGGGGAAASRGAAGGD